LLLSLAGGNVQTATEGFLSRFFTGNRRTGILGGALYIGESTTERNWTRTIYLHGYNVFLTTDNLKMRIPKVSWRNS
jgi:hypothetical protein